MHFPTDLSMVHGLTHAIEYLTTALREAVSGHSPQQSIAWAREVLDKTAGVMQVPAPSLVPSDYASPGVPTGYATILGYLAVEGAAILDLMEEPVGDTMRDGWWLLHRCKERGVKPVKVPAPPIAARVGITEVNAYPIDLLEKRFG